MENIQKININSLDIAKVVAALFVVAAHKDPFQPGFIDNIMVGMMSRIAVPFFYIASAFLFFLKGPITNDKLWRYVKRMLVLFIFWFIIEIPFMYIKYFAHSENICHDIIMYVQRLFLGNVYDGAYFIIALIECVPLVYFLGKRIRNECLFVLGLVLYAVTSMCDTYYAILPYVLREMADYINITIGDIAVSFIPAFIFVVSGKIIAEKYNRISKLNFAIISVFLFLSLFACYWESSNSFFIEGSVRQMLRMPICRIPAAIFLFIFVLKLNINAQLPYKEFRKFSTIMFFSQFIFINLTYLYSYHFTEILHLNNVGQFFFIIFLCIATYFIMDRGSRTKLLRWMRYGF